MVRILSNGEIVPDDDPRAKNRPSRNNASTSNANSTPGYGYGMEHQQQQPGNSVSMFTMLNDKLISYGIPRWSAGGLSVEPIVSVALLLSLLLFGFPGILLVVILFAVSQLSRDTGGGNIVTRLRNIFTGGTQQVANRNPASAPGPSTGRPNPNANDATKRFGGVGRRLGDM